MNVNRIGRIRRNTVVALGVLLVASLGVAAWSARSRDRVVKGYTPDESVARIAFRGDSIDEVMLVRDFATSGHRMYLLDAMAPRVLVMNREGDTWKRAGGFGSRGAGPGELLRPTGIAVDVATQQVAVADMSRIHFFTGDGTYIETRAPMLPCAMNDMRLSGSPAGLLLSGRCTSADTVVARLFLLTHRDSLIDLASDPLYTMDGKFGSILTASTWFSADDTGGMFGGGTTPCVTRVNAAVVPAKVSKQCTSETRYEFAADPAFRAKADALAAAKPWARAELTIPRELPVYVAALSSPKEKLWLRPVNNDSIAFREVGKSRDLAVAGVDGLLGCDAGGCLWIKPDEQQMMYVTRAQIARITHTGN